MSVAREAKRDQNVRDLTEGSPAKLLLLFSLPLMAGNLCQQLYTLVDTAVVGQALGVETLAALGTVDALIWLTFGIAQGFTQGFGILMAQYFGAGDRKRLRRSLTGSVLLSVLCAVLLTALSEGLARPVLRLLHTPEDILPISMAYLRILLAGIPVVTAYNLAACTLRALGDSRTPLLAMVAASLTNIGLDLLFVMAFRWGVEGAAIATVFAQLLSALFCFARIRKMELLRVSREDWSPDRQLSLKLLSLGLPMAFQNVVIAVGSMIVQFVVNGFGVVFIAGLTATNKLYGLLETAATSYGYAMVTYAGQNLGAGKRDRVSRGMRAGILIAMATSAFITAAMLLFGREILSLFISAEGDLGTQALAIAYRYLSIMSLFLPILYVLHITRSCIQGLGDTVLPMVSGCAEFLMRTGTALLLPLFLGEKGILYAEPLAWLGADLVLVPSYFYTMHRIWGKGRNG